MKQGWLMFTAVAGLGLLTSCSKPEAPASAAAGHEGPELVIQSEAQFAEQVEQVKGVVLVDFWATWCPPCRIMNPILKQVAQDYQGRLTVAKVDVDEQPALSDRFKIRSIPTMILFKNGQAVEARTGAMPKEELTAWLNGHLTESGG